MPFYDVQGLCFDVIPATAVAEEQWLAIHALQREASGSTLLIARTQEEVDAAVQWRDHDRFVSTRLDPASDASLYEGQLFAQPLVAVAYDGDELVAYNYSADNTSGGSERLRQLKMVSIVKRYAWVRDIAVDPRYEGRGLAHTLGALTLMRRNPLQGVAIYVWLDNNRLKSWANHLEENLGFVPTGSRERHVFGDDSAATEQLRLQARFAGLVTHRILSQPGARKAIDYAKRHRVA